MSYRKYKGSAVFDGYKMLPGNLVLITDDTGIVKNLVDEKDAGGDIQEFSGTLCPGFINAHCHLELSHLKGFIPEQTGLVDFVLKVVTGRHFEEDKILAAIAAAEEEMLQNGIVAVGDICNNTLTIPQKKLQRLHYHNFIEVSGFPPAVAAMRFERSTTILEAYDSSLITHNSLSPHAPYSVSPDLFKLINEETANQVITIHNQEVNDENVFFQKREGDFLRLYDEMNIDISFFEATKKSSLQTWLPYFSNKQSIVLVHDVATKAEDIAFSELLTKNSELRTFFCLCPNANLYISNTLPDIELLVSSNINIILGTDSLASNHQLSIWEEIATLRNHFPNLKTEMLLRWATSNGAKALGMDKLLGSFEKGKQPGVLLLTEAVKRLI